MNIVGLGSSMVWEVSNLIFFAKAVHSRFHSKEIRCLCLEFTDHCNEKRCWILPWQVLHLRSRLSISCALSQYYKHPEANMSGKLNNWHLSFRRPSGSWVMVIDQNMQDIVVINNSRTACPTKILITIYFKMLTSFSRTVVMILR